MKKLIITSSLIVFVVECIFCQERWSISKVNEFCNFGTIRGYGVEVWNDAIYASGITLDSECKNAAILLKFDLNGNLLAQRVVEDSIYASFNVASEVGMDMIDWNSSDDFILPYNQYNSNFDSTKMYIRKFDTNLEDIWIQEIQRPIAEDNAFANVVRRDFEGNIFISCFGRKTDFDQSTDIPYSFIQKLNPQGDLIWQTVFEGVIGTHEITLLSDGDILLNGMEWNTQSSVNGILIQKLDSMGIEDWRYTTGGLYCRSSTCVEDSQGHLIMSTNWNDDNPPNQYIDTPFHQFRKIQDTGDYFQEIDEVKFGRFGQWKEPNASKILSDGSTVTAGSHNQIVSVFEPPPYTRGYLFKVDQNLDSVWFRTYWHPEEFTFWGSCQIMDFDTVEGGGFVCTGIVTRASQQDQDELWLMRLDEFGCLEPGCQLINVSEIVIGFENSMKVFPNPVRDHATVQFEIPNPAILQNNFSKTQLIVTDINGREIERMNLPSFGARYQLELNTSQYAAGLYQVHWVSGGTWLDTVELVKE
jgi:hypothetical protein